MIEHINHFIAEQRTAIAEDEIEPFLRSTFQLFYQFGTAPALQGRHLPSPVFDELCQAAGARSRFELMTSAIAPIEQVHDIVVLTEVVTMGGHAMLVKDIVYGNDLPVVLVVTNINNRNKPLLKQLQELDNVLDVQVATGPSLLNKLHQVQIALNNRRARRILLANHGYDVLAVSAIGPDISGKTLYLHHCDHYPALGCYLPGVAHVDLHNLGFVRCRHEHGITGNRYLCLTTPEPANAGLKKAFAAPCLLSATCGSVHKLQSLSYQFGYKEVLLKVLGRHKGIHYHIGHLPPEFVREIGDALETAGISRDQFCHLGEAPGLADVLTQLEVDLYIPTLPQSGGKALIEAMAAGVPVLLHENARDRIWGSVDLVYPEAVRWRDLQELDAVLDTLDEQFWRTQSGASRRYFERFHSSALFAAQLRSDGVDAESTDIPPLKRHQPDIGAYLLYANFTFQ